MRRTEAFVTLLWPDEKITSVTRIHYTYHGFLITRYSFAHFIILECKYLTVETMKFCPNNRKKKLEPLIFFLSYST